MVWTNQAGWTQEEIDNQEQAEQEMNDTMSNPGSTWTEISEAIDNFFNQW